MAEWSRFLETVEVGVSCLPIRKTLQPSKSCRLARLEELEVQASDLVNCSSLLKASQTEMFSPILKKRVLIAN